MGIENSAESRVRIGSDAALLAAVLLAFGSGAAALIYEVVWFQLLELVIGSTAVSLGILLATFMGGMCLGSWLLPRVVSNQKHALRIYAVIECSIGILAVLVLRVLPSAGGHTREIAGIACLLPPTVLMGAALPALARAMHGTENEISWLGFLYGANIAGAVTGCLLAGFYLLRQYDVSVATYAAVAINVSLAGAALVFRAKPSALPLRFCAQPRTADKISAAGVYFVISLSGLCALAAEVIWTRILALLFGASVYAFSIIVAVFLAGLGIGAGLGAWLCRLIVRARAALGWCQLLVAPTLAWTAYNLGASLPYWPVNPSISTSVWFTFELDLACACWALLPATILWGASFPLALRAAASKQEDAGNLMGSVYAANTIGAIAGALASLLLIAWVGSQRAQQVLIALSLLSALLLLAPAQRRLAGVGTSAAAVLFAILLIHSVPPLAGVLIAYGRYAATWVGKGEIVYAGEGLNSFVAVSRFPNGVETFHVAGKIQASNVPRDMRLQRMLGHLTTLANEHPRSVLVIGCGAGVTAGAVSIDPRVERETIVEIEPLVPQAASKYFGEANFNVLNNPKVRLLIEDGRRYLMTTKQRFDGITIDPLDPWVKGAASFYTQEFLEILKQHLSPGGVVTLYIQLFQTEPEAVKSAVATFFQVFPNGTIWGNPSQGEGHDMVLLGTAGPLRIGLDQMEQRIGSGVGMSRLASSLAEIGMNSPADLFATYAGRAPDLTRWLAGAPINHDWNLRMQYLAGLGLDRDEATSIYAGMLAYRRFPNDLFFSAEGKVEALRAAILRRR